MQLLILVAMECLQYKDDSSYDQQDEDCCKGQSHSKANGLGATTGARSAGSAGLCALICDKVCVVIKSCSAFTYVTGLELHVVWGAIIVTAACITLCTG